MVYGTEDMPIDTSLNHLNQPRDQLGRFAKPQWSGTVDPIDPDNFWIDDITNERVNANTGERIHIQSQVVPVTQPVQERPMNFNPDDANAVSRFFQNIADKVVLASSLAKEVEELQIAVGQLRKDVELFRESNARLDEEVSRLRQERNDLANENSRLKAELEKSTSDHETTTRRYEASEGSLRYWRNEYDMLTESLGNTKRDRDDALMHVMELEDTLRGVANAKALLEERVAMFEQRESTIRSALAA